MMYHDRYAAPRKAVDQLVQETLLGRLVTVGPEGALRIGLFPFIIGADSFDLHLNKNDEQLADLRSNDRCLFEVDEVLAVVPSHWEHPENAANGTAYYRAAVFECTAKMSADPEKLAEHLRDIMERYQPEGGYRPIAAPDPMYEGMIGMLEKVSLEIGKRRAKFKLAQNRATAVRTRIIGELRSRGRTTDDRAADRLEWTLDRD